MGDDRSREDVESEELLDGQAVFKGPRKLKKLLLGRRDEDSGE